MRYYTFDSAQLTIPQTSFYSQMLSYAHSVGADEAAIKQVFDCVVPILEVQAKFAAELDQVANSWKTKKGIGELFQQYVRSI